MVYFGLKQSLRLIALKETFILFSLHTNSNSLTFLNQKTLQHPTNTTYPVPNMVDSSKYSLYIFLILVGCVASIFIGLGIWSMYHPLEDDMQKFAEVPDEQRAYWRRVRQQTFNGLAVEARRPEFIVQIDQEK